MMSLTSPLTNAADEANPIKTKTSSIERRSNLCVVSLGRSSTPPESGGDHTKARFQLPVPLCDYELSALKVLCL